MMTIGRTLPPAAAPLGCRDLWHGVAGSIRPRRAIRAREAEFRRHLGVGHVWLVSSGTAALAVALSGLRRLSERTEVIVPAYTCYSVPAAVLKAGLRPVLCDIDARTFDHDHAQLERLIGPNTLGVVVHHLFGIPSDVAHVRALCRRQGVFVVEDAAQALGVESAGGPLGTSGDVGVYSFGRGKHVTCGSGGLLATNSARIAGALDREFAALKAPSLGETVADLASAALMALFIRPGLYWMPAAVPFLRLGESIFPRTIPIKRLSGAGAGLLAGWRSRLIAGNRQRAESAAALSDRLSLTPACGPAHPYLRLPVFAETPRAKARLTALSRARGLGLSPGYPAPISEIPEIRPLVEAQRFPHAEAVAAHLVTLPTHHWLSARDRSAIAASVRSEVAAVPPSIRQRAIA